MILGIVAAAGGAVAYGGGSVLQSAATTKATGANVWRHPLYIAGLLADAAAWVASLVALREVPVFAVQAILAGSLAITVILASAFLHVRMRRRDVISVVAVVLALVMIAGSAGPQSAASVGAAFTPIASGAAAACVLALLVLFKRGGSPAMAVLAGVAFSGAALCARGLSGASHWSAIVGDPLAWAILAFGVVGAVAYARALELGNVGAATATMWVVEVVLPGIVGIAVMGDQVRAGWAVPAAIAVAIAVAASFALATSPTTRTVLVA